ncbi:hypothetical protein VHA_002253 [Grimontia hollisae CIP 101886]|uniref:Uncharacterized protein n=1 Tax=Grimontia hollisae CIP 101886 TaxID=675812 RepID=D0I9W6_GRIHO|nr:hypothetical protein VHA_002253 [Grimontia hollisae CIP 101886]
MPDNRLGFCGWRHLYGFLLNRHLLSGKANNDPRDIFR